jgi:hypothetical protein
MAPTDRRSVLTAMFQGGALVATVALGLTPDTAEARRVYVRRSAVVVAPIRRRAVVVAPVRRRFWHCAYAYGKDVCGWRYY